MHGSHLAARSENQHVKDRATGEEKEPETLLASLSHYSGLELPPPIFLSWEENNLVLFRLL